MIPCQSGLRAVAYAVLIAIVLSAPALAASGGTDPGAQAGTQNEASPDRPMAARSEWSFMSVARGLLGLAFLIGLAWLMSHDRKRTPWKLVFSAIGMQLALGLVLITWEPARDIFQFIADTVTKLLGFTDEGTRFVFGDASALTGPGAPALAFTALPTIIFFSCLMAVLYHLRVMHVVSTSDGSAMPTTMRGMPFSRIRSLHGGVLP